MVYRVYVEKRPGLTAEADALAGDIRTLLGISSLKGLRLLNRYDVENISPELFDHSVRTILSEPQLDVVTDTLPPDCSFESSFAAVLLAPPRGKFCAEALSAILSGREEPTGRLTRTCLSSPDAFFRTLREDKRAGRIKTGAFIGYRYTETAGVRARYAFGHGLGYTRFSYSSLQIEANRVTFTLKNCGDRDGTEVVQVYVAPPDALFPVPKRQLCAFQRVFLRAGESRQLTVSLPPDAFSVYDSASRLSEAKAGVYAVRRRS